MANIPEPSSTKLTETSLLEQRERAAAEFVKVLEQVKAEIARARALLDRIGREQNIDLHRNERLSLLTPHVDPQLGSTRSNGDEER